MIATSVVGGGQEEQHCQAAAKLRPRLSRIHRLLRKCNYASRVGAGAGAAVMSGMVSFSIFFTLQWFFTNFTIMLLCRCVRKDSSKAAQSCYSPQASPGVEGEIHLWHFSTQLCNYVTEVATNVYPFRPADHRGRTEQHHESVLGHNNFPRTMTNLSKKMAARSWREKTQVRNYFRFC